MKKYPLLYCCCSLGFAAPAGAATLVSLSTFGGGDGWRAPNEIISGDTAGTATGSNYNYLGTGNLERGLAYNPATGNLIVVSRSTAGNGIRVLSGTTGADIGSLNQGSGVITGGAFAINSVGVGGDGVVYVGNLQTNISTANYSVYTWANESATVNSTPFFRSTVAGFTGTPRIGDNLDVIGSGSSTTLVAGGNGTTGYLVVTPTGATAITAFTPTGPLTGDFRLGITFAGSANEVWGKQTGASAAAAPLRETTYSSLAPGTSLGTATLTSGGEMALDYISINSVPYLATLDANSSLVRIYDVTNPLTPSLLTSATTTSGTLTGNVNGAGSIKWGAVSGDTATLYAMSTNQGIQAFTFTVPEPSSTLLGLAGLGLLLRRRRK
jgi:hypothetical protein